MGERRERQNFCRAEQPVGRVVDGAVGVNMGDAEFNQKVYTFAQSQAGQRVGAGECWDLADRALKHAGAAFRRRSARTMTTSGGIRSASTK
jgi:hypothetical protein